ncbi:hypothetical protein [Treponema zioleckii]|uniref:hypothetical protein n=1 Tax=Treponema zioleckii TaxID=331680 RepID=UPI00168BA100|nr:hypothetical protein [Treponema zioleckii]
MKKFYLLFILLIVAYTDIFSHEFIKKVGIDYFKIDNSSENVKITPVNFLESCDNYVFHNDINNNLGGYLLRNINSLLYSVVIFDYSSGTIKNEYHLDKDSIKSTVKAVYFTEDNFYTLENDAATVNLIKRNFTGESSITRKIAGLSDENIKTMIVDEKNNSILFSASAGKVLIYSLKTGNKIFEDTGRLLYSISHEAHKLYYSKGHEIICVDYLADFSKKIIQTFVESKKEKIVELAKINDSLIMVTQKEKANLFCKIVFNTIDWKNIYYLCYQKDGKLIEKKQIYIKKQGIIF